jgi:hypothetical protein
MDTGEPRARNATRISRVSKQRQLERVRAYQEAMESTALSRQHYESVKMEATVKAFVDGNKKKADVQKYITEEARLIAVKEKEERQQEKLRREHRICIASISLAGVSVLLALYFMILHR